MRYEDRDEPVVVVERGGASGHQVAAFLLGLALGAGAALLFAPQSGAETRAEIAKRARRVRRNAEEFAGTVRERAATAVDTARSELKRRTDEARDAVDEVIDDVKLRVEAGREAGRAGARAAREELQRRLADARSDRGGDRDS